MQIFLRLSILAVFLTNSLAYRLNEDAAKEMECIPSPSSEDIGLDLKWFESVETFYVPFWSKLYAHRTASDLLEKEPRLISDQEMGPSSCLVMKKGQPIFAFGREAKYNMSGDATSISFKAPWPGAKSAKFSFHLTDNKTYILGVTCWEDNQSGWAVMSSKPRLSPVARMKILEYVKSIGFNEELSVDENYGYCDDNDYEHGINRNFNQYPHYIFTQVPFPMFNPHQYQYQYFNPYQYYGMTIPKYQHAGQGFYNSKKY